MPGHRIFKTSVASVYPHYVTKAERKGRTKADVDRIICWLTGYSQEELERRLREGADFETFFAEATAFHPNSALITGVVCGVRVEEVEDPLMKKIRQLDKLIDELARGRTMERILRQQPAPPQSGRRSSRRSGAQVVRASKGSASGAEPRSENQQTPSSTTSTKSS